MLAMLDKHFFDASVLPEIKIINAIDLSTRSPFIAGQLAARKSEFERFLNNPDLPAPLKAAVTERFLETLREEQIRVDNAPSPTPEGYKGRTLLSEFIAAQIKQLENRAEENREFDVEMQLKLARTLMKIDNNRIIRIVFEKAFTEPISELKRRIKERTDQGINDEETLALIRAKHELLDMAGQALRRVMHPEEAPNPAPARHIG